MRATNRHIARIGLESLCGVACLLLTACASSASAPPPPVASLPPAAVDSGHLQDRGWAVLRSASLGMKLALPEARSWLDESSHAARGAGWELRHEPTGSSLSVRRWRASRLPRIEACEAELGARTPNLVLPDESNVVARRLARVPDGFSTRITLVALPGSSGGQRLRGQVTAVGAGIGECISVVARTECGTEAELAERLRLLDVVVGHLRLTHIEERVPDRQPISP
jgi:hypothetical protein